MLIGYIWVSLVAEMVKIEGDPGLIPSSRRYAGEGNGRAEYITPPKREKSLQEQSILLTGGISNKRH